MMKGKKWKHLIMGVTAVLTAGIIAGCGGGGGQKKTEDGKKMYKVGIVQLVEHNALDAANKGFVDGLKKRGYEEGKNIEIDRQNAQADQSNLANISQRFISNKANLICAIATPAAQTVANATKPIKEQVDLLMKFCPNAKTVGVIYCSSEVNSEVQVKAMKEYAASKGLKVETATISTVNDIQQAAQSLVSKVDAFYAPTDNVLASAMPTLLSVTDPAKKPVICGEENMVKAGGLATYGIDYYKLGLQTGDMGADILDGKKKPADMPIQTAKDLKASVNKKSADALGVKIPDDVMKSAEIIQ